MKKANEYTVFYDEATNQPVVAIESVNISDEDARKIANKHFKTSKDCLVVCKAYVSREHGEKVLTYDLISPVANAVAVYVEK